MVSVQALISSVWAARCRDGSEALRLIFGRECWSSSMEDRIWNKATQWSQVGLGVSTAAAFHQQFRYRLFSPSHLYHLVENISPSSSSMVTLFGSRDSDSGIHSQHFNWNYWERGGLLPLGFAKAIAILELLVVILLSDRSQPENEGNREGSKEMQKKCPDDIT